jgi:hypothetical protein
VNDAAAMGDTQRFGDVADPGASARIRHCAFLQNFVQRLAFEIFHDEIGRRSRFGDAHIVQRDDIGVRELSDGTSFLKEALAAFAVGEVGREKLDGHGAADEWIKSARDAAESASADGIENLVASNLHSNNPLRACRSICARIRTNLARENGAEVLFHGVLPYWAENTL